MNRFDKNGVWYKHNLTIENFSSVSNPKYPKCKNCGNNKFVRRSFNLVWYKCVKCDYDFKYYEINE